MKVLLNENVENLGRLGDLVEVKPGYARNYLYPRKLAVQPTKHNMEVMKYKKIKAEKQLELDKLSAMEQKKKLEEITLTIEKKAGESDTLFGSVTTMEIQHLLEERGVEIERKKIHLDEHIKTLGTHTCRLKLIEEIEAEIKIEVVREGGEPEPTEEPAETPAEPIEPTAEENVEEVVEEPTEEVVEETVQEEPQPETEPEKEEAPEDVVTEEEPVKEEPTEEESTEEESEKKEEE